MIFTNPFKTKPDLHHDEVKVYTVDLRNMTHLRDKATGEERTRYDYIIEVMQRTLTVLIDDPNRK